MYGGLDEWSKFWQVVAEYFKQQSYVLGYELMNEPWAGDVVRIPPTPLSLFLHIFSKFQTVFLH